jgi:hypothetical protein
MHIAANSGMTREMATASPIMIVKAVGFAPETRTSVTVTDKIKVTMTLQ